MVDADKDEILNAKTGKTVFEKAPLRIPRTLQNKFLS